MEITSRLYALLSCALTCVLMTQCEKDIHHPLDEWQQWAAKRAGRASSEPYDSSAAKWIEQGQEALRAAIERQNLNTNVAKNVIIFIGDGMGVATVTAARIMAGQEIAGNLTGEDWEPSINRTSQNKINSNSFDDEEEVDDDDIDNYINEELFAYGEEHSLSFEKFPYVALTKTYNTDWQVPDSAGSATAILCGIKTRFSVVGVDDRVVQGVCPSQEGADVDSILYWALEENKSAGVISTMAITHATPASAYASAAWRVWESDADMTPSQKENCSDIARQLIEKGHNIQVVLGGGRANFIPRSESDPVEPEEIGNRRDGRNLINEWAEDKANKSRTHAVVYTAQEMQDVDSETTDFLFGLFSRGSMSFHREKSADQPSLTEMTEKAIEILQRNANGYVLVVEGGKIDGAHHDSRAKRALTETIEFANAVELAVNMTSEEDTLILVTADHSHAFTVAGYNAKGTQILGRGIYPALDLMPYTKILYGNGQGYGREDIREVDTTDNEYVFQSAVPLSSETHTADDVAVYARGPMAHLMQGVQEQNYVAHVAGYAACIGFNKDHCTKK